MGNAHRSFRIGSGPLHAARELLGLSLGDIQQAFVRFDELSRLPGVDVDMFAEVFPMVADPEAAFAVFDVAQRGKIDILEVFAAVSLASNAAPNERKKFTFQFYDFDGSRCLNLDELVIMLRSVLVGVAKLTDGSAPSMAACEEVSKAVFSAADSIKDSRITYVEFSHWVRSSDSAKALLSCFDRAGKLKPTHRLPTRKKHPSRGRDPDDDGASRASPRAAGKGKGKGKGTGAGTGAGAGAASAASESGDDARSTSAAAGSVAPVRAKASALARRSLRSHFQRGKSGSKASGAVIPPPSPAARAARRDPRDAGVKYAKSEIITIKRMFDKMDSDMSGSVDVAEFARSLNDRMLSHMRGMFDTVDRDKSGSITFQELLTELYPYASTKEMAKMIQWVTPKKRPEVAPTFRLSEAQIAELKHLFDIYDLNRSGAVDMDEMFAAMANTGVFSVEEIRDTFAAADIDRNAMLSFSEFKQFFKDVFGAQEDGKRHSDAATRSTSSPIASSAS